jgi:ubiquinone/menaquinone biosynthesis C-methylase UbiE
VNDRLVDREYLTGVQYASDANLSARQSIYRFQQPAIRISGWGLNLAGLHGDESVADVGCGNGLHLAELQRREHRGVVVGMDLSPGMLDAARLRSDAFLLTGDAQRLPFSDASFDCVLAMHMLYHVPDRDLAIAEMRRVLRPGGVLLALTNSHRHLEELNDLVGDVLHEHTGADPALLRAYLRFSSESGGEELQRHFTEVQRHDALSELIVPEVQPIVDYVSSMGSIGAKIRGATGPVLRDIEQRVRATIERDGAFRIRTDVGCFVCR